MEDQKTKKGQKVHMTEGGVGYFLPSKEYLLAQLGAVILAPMLPDILAATETRDEILVAIEDAARVANLAAQALLADAKRRLQ